MISCDCHRTTVSIGTQTQRNSSKTKVTNCTYMFTSNPHSPFFPPFTPYSPSSMHIPYPIKSDSGEVFQPHMPPGRLPPVANCGRHGALTLNTLCSYSLTPSISSFITSISTFFLSWPCIPPFFPGPQGLSGNSESAETQADFTEIRRRLEQLKAKH